MNRYPANIRLDKDVLQRCLQDIFKTYSSGQTVYLGQSFALATLLKNLWSVQKICKSDKNVSSLNFPFSYIF